MKAAKTTMPATQSGNSIVVYEPDETMRLDVRLENETVWLTQEQMCQLFGRTQSVIARHIGNIFKEGELDRKVVYAKFAYTTRHGAIEGKTQTKEVGLYNLDVVISVGYRVKSVQGTRFRQWATQVLKDYLLRGQALNARMNALELLAKKAKGVTVEIVTSRRGNKISASDVAKFNAQHGGLTVTVSKNFHDRFIAIDGRRLYLVGASLKDLGWKCFAFTELDASEIPNLKARI